MTKLTDRQGEILNFIYSYLDREGAMPTLSEISSSFGFSDKAALDVVNALINKGRLERSERKGHRTIRLTEEERDRRENRSIELYSGRLTPLVLSKKSDEEIFVPRYLARLGNIFAIRVESLSMINAGIKPGDICIIQGDGYTLQPEDIVLALPSGAEEQSEIELRRYRKSLFFSELWPENDSMGIIKATEFKFYGVLKELIRSY